ncbi:Oxoglutarate/iron-dependent dioxygenase [Macleaya cordata]|uniref:Oxoglutarate/iron-dependent dioxygenase n=1 Tax=Macleaya cordata TaxID=56857 RepID=A0A200QBP5_MACCD|nr:Oxoglutarate/iron-dependent dioxygenase [Macleaya cordata]
MGKFSMDVRKVAMEVMGAITESLGLGPSYKSDKLEDGMQVMTVNCYPACPQPDRVLGLPPHSDYSCITVLLQSCPGLQVIATDDDEWRLIPEIHGALQVHVGDHLEVLSNGIYKSVVHRATLNSEKNKISIASLHSLAMDEKIETAKDWWMNNIQKDTKKAALEIFLNFSPPMILLKGTASLRLLNSKPKMFN